MINGLIIIDKPAGMTSHDIVARVRRALRTRRVGHTGTLDPFATGVLPICVGRATRLARFLSGDEKEYLARVRLGFATDSGDLTGTPLSEPGDARAVTDDDVRRALEGLRGRIAQIPPMHSAKKVGGVKLYEMARRGERIEREPVMVEIRELELLASPDVLQVSQMAGEGEPDRDHEGLTRDIALRVLCSAGTYVRVLAEDLGQRLGLGAHLVGLQRTRAGRFSLRQALTLEELERRAAADDMGGALIEMSDALLMPEVRLSAEEQAAVAHGRPIARRGEWRSGELGKLCSAAGALQAVAEYEAESGLWRPRVVMAGD